MATGCLLLLILQTVFLRHNLSALGHKDFVLQVILELLAGECISEYEVPPLYVTPLSVQKAKSSA